MLGTGLKIAGGGILAGAGTYGIHRYITEMPGSPESLEHSTAYRFMEGTFGGHNLLLNLGVGIGGNYASGRLQSRGRSMLEKAEALRSRGGGGRAMEGRLMAARGYHPSGSKRFRHGARPPVAARGYWNPQAKRFIPMGEETSKFLGQIRADAISGRLQRRHAGMLGKSGINMVKRATQLKRVANLAAWAPIAFMAFDMVSSLSGLPAPDHAPMQRRSASLSGTFMDTSMAYTQRRRALQAMHNSQMTGRAALGNEASIMHS